jgi:predicted transcriptional regulator/transcriptional regulator with XRE-family HTH domain
MKAQKPPSSTVRSATSPLGHRIRSRRNALGITQAALANAAGISASYMNLIEHDQRTIGGTLLLRLAQALDVPPDTLSGREESRLVGELQEVSADPLFSAADGLNLPPLTLAQASDLVGRQPDAARSILTLYRAYRDLHQQNDGMAEHLSHDPFLGTASHEVLTQITSIRSFSEILQDYDDMDDAHRRKFIDAMADESARLTERAGELFAFLGGRGAARPQASAEDQVDDLFDNHANHFPLIEQAAAHLREQLTGRGGTLFGALAEHLQHRHHVTVTFAPANSPADMGVLPRRSAVWSAENRTITLSPALPAASARFHLARMAARLEAMDAITPYLDEGFLSTPEALKRGESALLSAFSGALLFPYDLFLTSAQHCRYDIGLLQQQFQGSFEQICHRLATLRRPTGPEASQNAVPFHFLRVNIAGALSKPFSASGLRLPRFTGLCPRWVSHTAFLTPGQLCRQVGQLPSGATYLNISRMITRGGGGFNAPASHYTVTLGCDITFAPRLIYGDGLSEAAAQPVGLSCRTCPRQDCAQRTEEFVDVFST